MNYFGHWEGIEKWVAALEPICALAAAQSCVDVERMLD